MAPITVKAKIGNTFHPGLGCILVKGEEYRIEEEAWGEELFERPTPDWLSPAERAEQERQATEAKKRKKGGSE